MLHVLWSYRNTHGKFINMQKGWLETSYSTVIISMDPSNAVIEIELKICSSNVFLILITSEMNVLLKRNTEIVFDALIFALHFSTTTYIWTVNKNVL